MMGGSCFVDTGDTLVSRSCAVCYYLSLTHAYNNRRQVAARETRTGVCGEGGLFPAAAPASPARLKVRVLFKPEEDQEHKMFGSQFVRTRGSWEQWRN